MIEKYLETFEPTNKPSAVIEVKQDSINKTIQEAYAYVYKKRLNPNNEKVWKINHYEDFLVYEPSSKQNIFSLENLIILRENPMVNWEEYRDNESNFVWSYISFKVK